MTGPAGTPAWLVRKIREAIAGERFTDAAGLLDRRKVDPGTRRKLGVLLAKARNDWSAIRADAEQAMASDGPTPELLVTLAQVHLRDRDLTHAATLVDQALALDPDHGPAIHLGARIAHERADVPAALRFSREALRLDPGDTRSALLAVRLLNTIGEVQASLDEYQRVRARDPDHPLVRVFGFRYFAHDPIELRDVVTPRDADPSGRAARKTTSAVQKELDRLRVIFGAAPPDSLLRRPVVGYEAGQQVAVAALPGAPATAVMFTGFQDQMMGMPVSIFDRYIAARGLSAIYLKDFRRLFYLGGIEALAPDYPGTVTALAGMVRAIGAPRLFTIGASAGGLPALRYGVDLGAHTAISFAGRSLAGDSLHPVETHDWWGGLIDGRLRDSGLEPMADLRAFLSARSHATRIGIVFGADMAQDAAHARHVADLPGVSLHPVPGLATHQVIDHLVETADFAAFLADLLPLD